MYLRSDHFRAYVEVPDRLEADGNLLLGPFTLNVAG